MKILRPLIKLVDLYYQLRCYTSVFSRFGLNYENIFTGDTLRRDSVLTIAQTGQYVGKDLIYDYSGIVYKRSPYILNDKIINESFEYGGYNSTTGQCIFVSGVLHRHIMDPAFVVGNVSLDVPYLRKMFYNLRKQYATRLDIFLPEGYIKYFFGTLLDSSKINNYICSILSDNCSSFVTPVNNCPLRLSTLPIYEGSISYVDGNSTGCRIIHASLAQIKPAIHCPHVSLDPTESSFCKKSSNRTIEELFTNADMETYRKFAIANKIDPAKGYKRLE